MTDTRAMWTYYKGEWREGDVRILGAASQATWLGSLVFDGARLFEGVTPDLDRHSARANDSARALGLEPTLSANDIEALAREGLKKICTGHGCLYPPHVLGRRRRCQHRCAACLLHRFCALP